MNYLANIFSAASQLLNVIFFAGHPNESISGRVWRSGYEIPVWAINALFFWQSNHCRGAYNKDLEWAKEFSKTVAKGA